MSVSTVEILSFMPMLVSGVSEAFPGAAGQKDALRQAAFVVDFGEVGIALDAVERPVIHRIIKATVKYEN